MTKNRNRPAAGYSSERYKSNAQDQYNNHEPDRQALEEQFRDAMEAAGLRCPTTGFNDDGQWYEFDGEGIGESTCRYRYDGQSGEFEGPDGCCWEWQAGWDKARPVWPKPVPINPTLAAKPYPREALPSGIRAAVDTVQDFTQTPYALAASVAQGALSAAASHVADVQRAPRLQSSTALYLLMIAQSGERKTTLEKIFNKAIIEWQRERKKELEPDIKTKEAEQAAWQAKRAGILARIKAKTKKGEPVTDDEKELEELEAKPVKVPQVPQILHDEINRQTLGLKLAKGHPVSAIMIGEGGAFFGGYGMSKDNLMDFLAFLNKMHSGEAAGSERKTVESYRIERANVTLSIQVQNTVFREFSGRGRDLSQGIGFFARTLFLDPETTIGTRPWREPGDWKPVDAFGKRLTELLNMPLLKDADNILAPDILTFDEEGQKAWIAYHNKIEHSMAPANWLGDWVEFANKTAENVARIAALFHLYEFGPYGQISRGTFDRAAKITDWHVHEIVRYFGGVAMSKADQQAEKLDKWLIDKCTKDGKDRISKSEIMRLGPNSLRKAAVLDSVIQTLADKHRLILDGTNKTQFVEINPALLKKDNSTSCDCESREYCEPDGENSHDSQQSQSQRGQTKKNDASSDRETFTI